MSNFFDRLLSGIRKTLHHQERSNIVDFQERENWVDRQVLKLSRLKLYGFSTSAETRLLCNKIIKKYDFGCAIKLVKRFHNATDGLLLDYDIESVCCMIIVCL